MLERAATVPIGSRVLDRADRDLSEANTAFQGSDDLCREVYCILGIPVDATDMPTVLHAIKEAAAANTPLLISTPNLNYLVNSQLDHEFRESLLMSDLCPADGIPIVGIARLLGLPIKARVAGSDALDALRNERNSTGRLKLFLFGGDEGVAEAASKALNDSLGSLHCVGSIYPGFGTVEDMSSSQIIDQINASQADFLLVALGAKKGQVWLLRNHDRLQVPVRAHLGAAINFAAAKVRRAPSVLRRFGLEWLWRVKEEPHLWPRYWNDGAVLLRLMLTRVIPLARRTWWHRFWDGAPGDLVIESTQDDQVSTMALCGSATAPNAEKAIAAFRKALETDRPICVNLSDTWPIDARFLGLLLMLRKLANRRKLNVSLVGASFSLRKLFRLNGAEFLLTVDRSK